MKNYNYNRLDWVGWGWGRAGRGGSKKSKPIPTSPHGVGLKSCPIPTPPPLRDEENPRRVKRGRAGQAGGTGQNCHPYDCVL